MQIIASHFTFFEGMRKLGEDQGVLIGLAVVFIMRQGESRNLYYYEPVNSPIERPSPIRQILINEKEIPLRRTYRLFRPRWRTGVGWVEDGFAPPDGRAVFGLHSQLHLGWPDRRPRDGSRWS